MLALVQSCTSIEEWTVVIGITRHTAYYIFIKYYEIYKAC